MSVRIAFIMDPLASINPKKDSTLAMMLAAQRRGWELVYIEQHNLFKRGGEVFARCHKAEVFDDLERWFQLQEAQEISLGSLDVIMMRKDPPVDASYIYTTQLLDAVAANGTLVVNRPQSLRDCNEKIFATEFAALCPPVLISSDAGKLKDFYNEHGDIILKPLDGMGGDSIFRISNNDYNINVIIEMLSEHGSKLLMAQRYIPEIVDGDKRILLIDSVPVPYALARIPSVGESRGNLAAGGTGVARPLTDRDRHICEAVAPALRERGLLFVGIDVIGDYLTEINVTSPTCIRELDAQCDLDIASDLLEAIEQKL